MLAPGVPTPVHHVKPTYIHCRHCQEMCSCRCAPCIRAIDVYIGRRCAPADVPLSTSIVNRYLGNLVVMKHIDQVCLQSCMCGPLTVNIARRCAPPDVPHAFNKHCSGTWLWWTLTKHGFLCDCVNGPYMQDWRCGITTNVTTPFMPRMFVVAAVIILLCQECADLCHKHACMRVVAAAVFLLCQYADLCHKHACMRRCCFCFVVPRIFLCRLGGTTW